jgi:proteasome-associated ATPase
VATRDDGSFAGRHDDQVKSLTTQISFLEEEVAVLRRRLTDSPRQSRLLEERLGEAEARLSTVNRQNERMADTLREARDQIVALKEEVDRLTKPPSGFGIFLNGCEDGAADVFTGGRKMRVNVSPSVDADELRPGQEVVLNESLTVVIAQGYETVGEIVMLKEVLESGDRALVISHADEERVARLAEPLRNSTLRAGDSLLLEPRSGYVYERIPKAEVEELILEEVPDISYKDIGGLAGQIEQIRDAIELPYLHADLFREHQLRPPKGVLLYGPPGCGKTLIAKAVANSLAKQVAARTAQQGTEREGKSFFLNIKGPELLNKYVGETERHIRLVFQRAREKASEGMPVIVFFDEMDSIFRTRGSGVSSDVENTIVPQLLSEIDGVEGLENVIVIGASNREDMIDPAILRPGRLDVKIKIERPDAEAARDIFSKYVLSGLPLHPDDLAENGGSPEACVEAMIQRVVERMYSETEENRFLEVTYANGDKEVLYFRDFNSGAMIQNIVDRAKKNAIKSSSRPARRACGWRTCCPPAWTSSAKTRTCPTPPTRTTGPASPARRASGSSTSGPWSPASRAPRPGARSTRSPTPASTSKWRRTGARGCSPQRSSRARLGFHYERAARDGYRDRVRHLGTRPARCQCHGHLLPGRERLPGGDLGQDAPGAVGFRGGEPAPRCPRLRPHQGGGRLQPAHRRGPRAR